MLAGTAGTAVAHDKHAVIVVDAKTGRTIYADEADALRYPASLTKMMTLYLTFEALQDGKITMNTPVTFSHAAASQEPSKIYVPAGHSIPVQTAILSIVTRSANDSAWALGELLGGTEDNFARLMTKKARALGMSRTTYKNANGLPAKGQMVTARDMATLGIALREHFPQYYHFFSVESFQYNGHTIRNHDHLIGKVPGVDGIKTGYTNASGFNLVTSIEKNHRSVVAVVMGGRSWRSRDDEMKRLLAKYVPSASTTGAGDLIAETPEAATLSAIELPRHGPRPEFRGKSGVRIALAYANDASPEAFPMPAPRPVVGRSALIKTLQEQQQAIAAPAAQAQAAATAPTPRPVAAVSRSRLDGMTTASTSEAPSSGWVIQIGATPDRASAVRLLDKAKSANHRLLASAQPFTVTTSDDGHRVYRARFGGFDSKDRAWAACADLKKRGYGCWASER